MPLTNYIIALIRHPDLANADTTKAAARYGIREDWARYYLAVERNRRGM